VKKAKVRDKKGMTKRRDEGDMNEKRITLLLSSCKRGSERIKKFRR
jgi:hypothetical protein